MVSYLFAFAFLEDGSHTVGPAMWEPLLWSGEQSQQNSLGLLFCVEDTFEAGLGGCQRGLLIFASGTIFGQRFFDLLDRRPLIDGFLQFLMFAAGLRPRPPPGPMPPKPTARCASMTF